MDGAAPLGPVVVDVGCPRLALDVDQDAGWKPKCRVNRRARSFEERLQHAPARSGKPQVLTRWPFEEDGDERAEVALGVLVREKVGGEATFGRIVDRSNVLDVGGVLALAGHPDSVELEHALGGDGVLQGGQRVRVRGGHAD